MSLRASMFGLLLLLASVTSASSQGAGAVGNQAKSNPAIPPALARGVNLSHWFADSHSGYEINSLASFITTTDARLLVRAGFTHVRLPVSVERLFEVEPANGAFRSKLIEKIAMLNSAGLAVVVSFYATEDHKRALADATEQSRFVERWVSLARSLSHLSPSLVLFELLNEPYPLAARVWWQLQARTIEAIRAVAPANTIVANPGGWSGVEDYTPEFIPVRDANTVYTAHVYQPLLFTHQGASWVWPVAAQVAGLDWPLTPADAPNAARRGTTDEAAKQLDYQVADHQFQIEWLADLFDRLASWQRDHANVPVYIGEFGVYRAVVPGAARLRWHQETRKAFESRGWGWAVWDYAGGFGITSADPAHRILDQLMLDALGLAKGAAPAQRH